VTAGSAPLLVPPPAAVGGPAAMNPGPDNTTGLCKRLDDSGGKEGSSPEARLVAAF
jgi:hypothetical protein